jgi:hypothetical protein
MLAAESSEERMGGEKYDNLEVGTVKVFMNHLCSEFLKCIRKLINGSYEIARLRNVRPSSSQ